MKSIALAGMFALAALIAAAAGPSAAGAAEGDPIVSGTIDLKRSDAFNTHLKANGVQMKPKSLWLRQGDIDPVTGAADLRLGKLTFKKGDRKVVFGNLRATLGSKGVVRGSRGKLFRLRGGRVERSGFGARITGVKVKMLKGATRKINRKLGLGSLRRGRAGTLSLSYVPRTVKVTGGRLVLRTTIAAGSVGFKLFSHCVSVTPPGVTALTPASSNAGVPPSLSLPVLGGTISPAGVDGVLEIGGGMRITKNNGAFTPGGCSSLPPASFQWSSLMVDLQQLNVQADREVVVAPPGIAEGSQGSAVTHSIDPSDVTVTADPAARTITYSDALVTVNELSAGTLNEVFRNAGNAANNFAPGDPFAAADLIVNVR
jgi:hypothetical protein